MSILIVIIIVIIIGYYIYNKKRKEERQKKAEEGTGLLYSAFIDILNDMRQTYKELEIEEYTEFAKFLKVPTEQDKKAVVREVLKKVIEGYSIDISNFATNMYMIASYSANIEPIHPGSPIANNNLTQHTIKLSRQNVIIKGLNGGLVELIIDHNLLAWDTQQLSNAFKTFLTETKKKILANKDV